MEHFSKHTTIHTTFHKYNMINDNPAGYVLISNNKDVLKKWDIQNDRH